MSCTEMKKKNVRRKKRQDDDGGGGGGDEDEVDEKESGVYVVVGHCQVVLELCLLSCHDSTDVSLV